MKKITLILLSFLLVSVAAHAGKSNSCANALRTSNCTKISTTNPNFCSLFQNAAKCFCMSSGVPEYICKDPKLVYGLMMARFHNSLQAACEYQKDDTTQNCIDDWNCYLHGGRNSSGGLCSSTGRAC